MAQLTTVAATGETNDTLGDESVIACHPEVLDELGLFRGDCVDVSTADEGDNDVPMYYNYARPKTKHHHTVCVILSDDTVNPDEVRVPAGVLQTLGIVSGMPVIVGGGGGSSSDGGRDNNNTGGGGSAAVDAKFAERITLQQVVSPGEADVEIESLAPQVIAHFSETYRPVSLDDVILIHSDNSDKNPSETGTTLTFRVVGTEPDAGGSAVIVASNTEIRLTR